MSGRPRRKLTTSFIPAADASGSPARRARRTTTQPARLLKDCRRLADFSLDEISEAIVDNSLHFVQSYGQHIRRTGPSRAPRHIRMFDFEQYQRKILTLEHYVDATVNARFRRIAQTVPAGARVLDIACGSGTLLALLRDKGCVCVGIDMAPAAIKVARSKGLDAYEGNADAFDRNDSLNRIFSEQYDTVIFSKCLMYLRRRNDLISYLATKSIIINQGNPYYWKYLLGLRAAPPETIPYFLADGSPIEISSPRALLRWGESFGYEGKIIYGGRLRGRDMVVRLDRS
jgi:SAM-dependent methyltransferase